METSEKKKKEKKRKKKKRRGTFNNDIPAPFLAGDDHVDDAVFHAALLPRHADFPVLPPLGTPLDASVAVQHPQQPVCRVQTRVFVLELLVHLVVRRAVEGVDVGFIDRRPRKAHGRPGSKRDYGVGREGEDEVSFHRAVARSGGLSMGFVYEYLLYIHEGVRGDS